MANKMLIDASHPEETRVVVTRGHKIEEFDFESATRRQLRGNIYLAKVTRVEPSLQAAFIEYGGNRHGFLAFSEIHPDYYQIPVADRQALIEADARAERETEQEEERPRGGRRRRGSSRRHRSGETVSAPVEADGIEPAAEAASEFEGDGHEGEIAIVADGSSAGIEAAGSDPAEAPEDEAQRPEQMELIAVEAPETGVAPVDEMVPADEEPALAASSDVAETAEFEMRDEIADASEEEDDDEDSSDDDDEEEHEDDVVEQVGGGDALEDVVERPRASRRHYKIQEVIKRRQILLVQVVKEERGNKGAALTTYLSLAGRYSVLMPNTGKGGGISRKITSAEDRKRLKEMVQELDVPDGMGVILRTAGANRTKPEIKRDYEYLMRLWESVRELTLSSSAPALVYEEGSLVKRAIRDLYNKDIDEVLVSGEEAYAEAKEFMGLIMPQQSRAVVPYREPHPLFAHAGVEAQLDAMFSNRVTLKSGGYLVINPTEALVSIDVNSGRSTREHNIEDTALRTNLEAAEEVSRQLRLRDLAGLIVIDFIDMDESRNDRTVEKKLKDCLKNDRARIQVGRISAFGLMEMSRQRIRTGVLESSSIPCPHCDGTGFVRSTPSVALQVLRQVEEALLRSASHNVVVRTRLEVAFYMLNQKRGHLRELETRFGIAIAVEADATITGTTTFALDRGELATPVERPPVSARVQIDTIRPVDEPIEIDPTAEFEREEEDAAEAAEAETGEARVSSDEEGRKRRRRRRRRGGRGERREDGTFAAAEDGEQGGDDEAEEGRAEASPEGLRDGEEDADDEATVVAAEPLRYTDGPSAMHSPVGSTSDAEPARPNALADIGAGGPEAEPGPDLTNGSVPMNGATEPEPELPLAIELEPEPEPVAIVLTPPDPDRPKRGGWWSKAKAALGGS